MGGNPFLRFIALSLMVVFIVYVHGALAQPAEGNAIVSGHPHRPALLTAMQPVEAKAGDVHVFRSLGHFQQLQDSCALPDLAGANPAGLAREIKLLKPLMPEAANHSSSVNRMVYIVKHSVRHQPDGKEVQMALAAPSSSPLVAARYSQPIPVTSNLASHQKLIP